jgi:formylglycine-generating enzyme required for sulfatase activity
MRRLLVLAAFLVALPAGGVDIECVAVRDLGNPADDTGYGAVGYDYAISKYEVVNAQYTEFLNAVAATDAFGLYNANMADSAYGGITRSGNPGSYSYSTKPGFENNPVVWVSYWDALRFANWLHNGQPTGAQDETTTEDGAYTMSQAGVAANSISRSAGATIFLPSEDEWYKAAYFDAVSAAYFDYPTGTDAETSCVAPAADTGNSANCDGAVSGYLTDAGSYTLSASPSGTFDQGGNVAEWNEAIAGGGIHRGGRGGSGLAPASDFVASIRFSTVPDLENYLLGFRVASLVPEPGQVLLVLTGGLVLAAARRQRRA